MQQFLMLIDSISDTEMNTVVKSLVDDTQMAKVNRNVKDIENRKENLDKIV